MIPVKAAIALFTKNHKILLMMMMTGPAATASSALATASAAATISALGRTVKKGHQTQTGLPKNTLNQLGEEQIDHSIFMK